MKPHFDPDAPEPAKPDAAWIDSEAYDASEQRFAASLETPPNLRMNDRPVPDSMRASVPSEQDAEVVSAVVGAGHEAPLGDPDAWRQQVTDKLNKYRARRQPRAPRYPSLQLRFEPSDPGWDVLPAASDLASHLILDGSAAAAHVADNGWPADAPPIELPSSSAPRPPEILPETTARVIPFRRSVPAPPKPLDELAEPLQLFPRILDVPEVAPAPPALGGILIEAPIEETMPKRPGIDLPLQTSPVARRIFAAVTDLVIIAGALAVFGYIFSQINTDIPPLRQILVTGALVLATFWAGYQYLLLTYAGSTPGLMLAGLRLSQFDGSVVGKRTRRWRVLASLLSAISLGLGYAWCLLDEDQLCWHDRITRTHLAPKHS